MHSPAPIPPATRGSRSVRSGTTSLDRVGFALPSGATAGALSAITPHAFARPDIGWRPGTPLDPRLVWIASVRATAMGGKR
ncbi:hypothetical protein [Streptomyces sp. G45]|uniref:hypothetical protein n=1 Tax=Streptomyces sp. G45 TaxID=3406627 RepID=UPI003C1DFCC9